MSDAKPNILFVVNSLVTGGAERHVVSLLNALDTARFNLSLAYLKNSQDLLPSVKTDRLQSVTCCKVKSKIDGAGIKRLATLISTLRIDVVVCTNDFSLFYAMLARRKVPRPLQIVDVYHTTFLRTLKEQLQMLFYRPLFRRCDTLVYVCTNQRNYWHRKGLRARAERVIHNGIDTGYFTDNFTLEDKVAVRERFGFDADDYVVGLCAALRPEKAHVDFLRAIARLRAAGLPARALLIGEGPERAFITAQIDRLGLSGNAVLTGLQADVRPAIASCDVMVLTSHAIETFSIAALESMAMAKPMVQTQIGGADEQIFPGVNGFLYQPGDIGALTMHLTALAEPRFRTKLGQTAAQTVREQFTLDKMVENYTTLLEDSSLAAAQQQTAYAERTRRG